MFLDVQSFHQAFLVQNPVDANAGELGVARYSSTGFLAKNLSFKGIVCRNFVFSTLGHDFGFSLLASIAPCNQRTEQDRTMTFV